ncbi:MAG: phosphoenolpyruvate--protein phosphotransferase [Candidatus Omnitrophica bacterium]|nr:phosphoenolpyruvate--protein phosphotransferase [Candidatus Omnitrophota bacterium]
MVKLKGIPAAPGITSGPAYILGKEDFIVPRSAIGAERIPFEIQALEEALINTRKEIVSLQRKISDDMGQEAAEIFDAHLLVLEDRMLIEEVISRLKKERLSVAFIFSEVLKKYVSVLSRTKDEYLRERIADVNDVSRRVLRHLLGEKKRGLGDIKDKVIVVAHDLSPSDTAAMHKQNVCAFVTDIGGKTSHTAIMAKSLEISAVVGVEEATKKIAHGDMLIVDGSAGIVIVNPDEKTLKEYVKEQSRYIELTRRYSSLRDLPPETLDGKRVEIAANMELPEELPSVIEHGARGIGLYRTEFFYMNRKGLPSEEEHFQAYKHVAEKVKPHPVIIRTLDLGGDKFVSQLEVPHDMHPFLGWRAIRFCLARPDIFKVQLRAILRASVYGNLKLMYPMISGIEELKQTNLILEECKAELKKQKTPFNDKLEVGAMIEVPSAALTADILAKEASFFSIGTNDLIQYSLAIDRTNEKIAYLYEPAHPAVLRMIKSVIEAGHNAGRWVGMCGEMAGDPYFVLVLLGLGLDEFSMPPVNIPEVKQVIRSVTMKEASEISRKALTFSTGREVEDFIQKKFKELSK